MRGIFFIFDINLRAAAELDPPITFPAKVTADYEVSLRSTEKVVRVAKRSASGGRKVGVAVVFETQEIVPPKIPGT
jgi:hypothetical protein